MNKSNNQPSGKRKLWEPPWKYRESFFISAELLVLGFAFEALTGGRGISPISFPANLIIGILIIAVIVFVYALYRKTPLIRWMGSVPAAIGSISLVTLLVLCLGFLKQNNPEAPVFLRLTGLNHVKTSWPFLFAQIYFLATLAMVTIRRAVPFKWKNAGFLLNHAGLWITIFAAGLGAGDLQRLTVNLYEQKDFKNLAFDDRQRVYHLPFSMKLNDFDVDYYPPKLALFDAGTGTIKHEKGKNLEMVEEGLTMHLSNWTIHVDTFIESAKPHPGKGYIPADTVGTTPAAYVTARNKMDSIKQGWISAGSFRYRPKYLILNRNDILALTEPEPKKYSSLVEVRYNGTIENHDIEVNKPHKVMGWKIYQMGYDTRMGKWSELSVLEVVKDPWLPVVYIGFFMLIAGAIYLFWIGRDVKVKKEEENI